jgi:polyisoprenoid-binding protein YceI
MRHLFTLALVAVVGLGLSTVAADEKYALSGDNTKVQFIGTKSDGKHEGGFKKLTGAAVVEDGAPKKLEVEIDVESIYTDAEKLTAHLKSPDFFAAKTHPKSKFVSTKIEKSTAGYSVTGDLTLVGKTKSITFPATASVEGGKLTLKSKFKINRTDFGMTYGAGKIDDEVTLMIDVEAKQ